MDFTFFITDCSLKQKGEAAMNDVKCLAPAPNAALAKAANVLLCQTLQDMSANGEADYLEPVHAGGADKADSSIFEFT